eukprot:6200946-Pleurochrysis_carterae.AAC.6
MDNQVSSGCTGNKIQSNVETPRTGQGVPPTCAPSAPFCRRCRFSPDKARRAAASEYNNKQVNCVVPYRKKLQQEDGKDQ